MVIGLLAAMSVVVAMPVHGAVVLSSSAFPGSPEIRDEVTYVHVYTEDLDPLTSEGRTEIGLCLSLECSKESDTRRGRAIEILTLSLLCRYGMSLPNQAVTQTFCVGATGLLCSDQVGGTLPSPLIRYLSPECRALLPSGPSSRWFRPPRACI
jgi:hypothetical protein